MANVTNSTDTCYSFPCRHGGTCSNWAGTLGHNCTCPTAFRDGKECKENLDDCTNSSCSNGGTCLDGMAEFFCMCPKGFGGKQCQDNDDDCVTAKCKNGATCVDGVRSYTCRCTTGWSGALCDDDADECLSAPCANNGTCIDALDSFRCDCPCGWVGDTCKYDYNECGVEPCKNGAKCVESQSAGSYSVPACAYICECAATWQGYNCAEPDVDPPSAVVSIASSSACSRAHATDGDVITLSIEFSERVQRLDVSMLGHWLAANLTGRRFVLNYTVQAHDPAGAVAINTSTFYDFAQYPHLCQPISATSDGHGSITIDRARPTLLRVGPLASDNARPWLAKPTDRVTLGLLFSEPLASPPVVTLGGLSASLEPNTGGGPMFNATLRVSRGVTPEGWMALRVSFRDRVCLQGQDALNSTDGSNVTVDTTPPNLTRACLGVVNGSGGLAAAGDTLRAEITVSEVLQAPPQLQLGGGAAAATAVAAGLGCGESAGGTLSCFSAQRVVLDADPRGNASVLVLAMHDLAGNTGSASSDGSGSNCSVFVCTQSLRLPPLRSDAQREHAESSVGNASYSFLWRQLSGPVAPPPLRRPLLSVFSVLARVSQAFGVGVPASLLEPFRV